MKITPGEWTVREFGQEWQVVSEQRRTVVCSISDLIPGAREHADIFAEAKNMLTALRALMPYALESPYDLDGDELQKFDDANALLDRLSDIELEETTP